MDAGYLSAPVRPVEPGDHEAIEALLDAELAGRQQVRLGGLVDVLEGPGWACWAGGRCVGVATLAPEAESGRLELRVLVVAPEARGRGLAGRLVDVAANRARERGSSTVWLVTTNDNLDALRVYQRHGFRLRRLDVGAVDRARERKPTIPLVGQHGIPLHDELLLERSL